MKGRSANDEDVVSIIGPGMRVQGDCVTEGTLRVEGRVEGSVKAAKAVVIGEGGEVVGDIETQDAVVAGHVSGSISADSRVELQETCRVEGDIRSRRVKLEEGGVVDGRIQMGREEDRAAEQDAAGLGSPSTSPQPSPSSPPGPEDIG